MSEESEEKNKLIGNVAISISMLGIIIALVFFGVQCQLQNINDNLESIKGELYKSRTNFRDY